MKMMRGGMGGVRTKLNQHNANIAIMRISCLAISDLLARLPCPSHEPGEQTGSAQGEYYEAPGNNPPSV